MRLMLAASMCASLFAAALVHDAAAQPRDPGGALIGRVVVCRDAFAPVADPAVDNSSLLQDVPSPGGGSQLASMAIPVADVLVVVDATNLTTRTDDNGRFTVIGVPTSQPLSLSVLQQPNTLGVTLIDNVVVNQGQTLDLGLLVLGDGTDQTSGSGACSV